MKWPVAAKALVDTTTPNPDPGGGGGGGGGGSTGGPSGTVEVGIKRYSPARQLFLPTCYANAARPATSALRLDPNSDSVAASLVSQSNLGFKPLLGTISYSAPAYTVWPDVPRVPVKMHTQPPPNYQRAEQQILVDPGVPIPSTHKNQGDSDDEMIMVELDASGDPIRGHEFWRLRLLATPVAFSFLMPDGTTWSGTVSWECSSYLQIVNISTHPARSRNFNAGAYPNAPTTTAGRLTSENTNMSVAATRLPFIANLLTLEDVQRGLNADGTLTSVTPGHILNLSVAWPYPSTRYWPATATDGYRSDSPVIEGMRLFFDETVYTDAVINAMNVHPLCRLCIKFVRDKGMIVVDKAGSLEIDGEPSIYQYFNGTAPSAVLTGFPWGNLKTMAQTNGDGTALTDANPFPKP